MFNKRFLSFLLVLIMVFTVVGCKGEGTGNQGAAETTPPLGDTVTPTPDGAEGENKLSLLGTETPVPNKMAPVTQDKKDPNKESVYTDLLEGKNSDFDDASTLNDTGGWFAFSSGNVALSADGGVDGSKCIAFTEPLESKHSYSCPAINLYKNPITKAGTYVITFDIRLGGEDADSATGTGFNIIIRGNGSKDENSFIAPDDKKHNYSYRPGKTIDGEVGDWMNVEFTLAVLASDFDGNSHNWNLCLDLIDENVTEIYIDNFQVSLEETAPEKQQLVTEAETWVASEMTFIAKKEVADPVNTQTLDVVFTDGNREMTVPGFWDGTNIWRVRFALPTEGTWTYKTVFTDTSDSGVHNITGSINVKKYSGDLEIYKRGFVTTKENTRYFVYADGTPFFYLGDTHWNFLAEEYDAAGANAADLKTTSHFKYIVNRRVAQGFTVYQSEPLEAYFNLADGLGAGDITGLRQADKYFKYIADQGLVHANAQFFFPDVMIKLMNTDPDYEKLLDVLARNWVARYGAYPVMWTLAQEVDNDFYYKENTQSNQTMTAENNPWKKVCELLYKYDPHKNPISAHQEGSTAASKNTSASNSAFRDIQGHSWWATQWKPVLNTRLNFTAAADFWVNGQNKPAVMYEGRYASLWTNEYGARAQGWLSFLNGMYGHGYGAIDIWLYRSTYDMEYDTHRDGLTITLEEKSTPWGKAIEFASGYQMGYMKELLEKYEWWKLTPAFDSQALFTSATGTYSMAHIDSDLFITYFYDVLDKEGTKLTGVLKGLDASSEYTYYWFNPRTTAVSDNMKVKNDNGAFAIGERPSAEDWVLVVEKVK